VIIFRRFEHLRKFKAVRRRSRDNAGLRGGRIQRGAQGRNRTTDTRIFSPSKMAETQHVAGFCCVYVAMSRYYFRRFTSSQQYAASIEGQKSRKLGNFSCFSRVECRQTNSGDLLMLPICAAFGAMVSAAVVCWFLDSVSTNESHWL
jgi:hypothetical protein